MRDFHMEEVGFTSRVTSELCAGSLFSPFHVKHMQMPSLLIWSELLRTMS